MPYEEEIPHLLEEAQPPNNRRPQISAAFGKKPPQNKRGDPEAALI